MIYLSHKIELDPTVAQARYFAQACGVSRFSYNWALVEWQRQYKAGEKPSELALNRQLNVLKGAEFPWMSEVTKCAPQQAVKNLWPSVRGLQPVERLALATFVRRS
jgi:putative transposase